MEIFFLLEGEGLVICHGRDTFLHLSHIFLVRMIDLIKL